MRYVSCRNSQHACTVFASLTLFSRLQKTTINVLLIWSSYCTRVIVRKYNRKYLIQSDFGRTFIIIFVFYRVVISFVIYVRNIYNNTFVVIIIIICASRRGVSRGNRTHASRTNARRQI